MLRGIDRQLDLNDLRQSLKPFYSQIDRLSVDPELMIRMLIVGYCRGIATSKRAQQGRRTMARELEGKGPL
jgi:transposase